MELNLEGTEKSGQVAWLSATSRTFKHCVRKARQWQLSMQTTEEYEEALIVLETLQPLDMVNRPNLPLFHKVGLPFVK